jgi:molecular chaperone DnaK
MTYQLGVDLGTTFTAAAVAKGGRAEIIELGTRSGLMPSVVWLAADGRELVGEAAWRLRLTEPDCVAREVKRHVGDPIPVLTA